MPTFQATRHEEQLVAAGRGKWSVPGVPHRGWSCVDIEDLGAPEQTCEMCESQTIRFVHHMEHPKYPGILVVGCICAGHMEGDLVAAQGREAAMRSRAGKRSRWLSRKWKTSAKGNPYIRADGYQVTVYPRGTGWGTTISVPGGDFVQHSRLNFSTPERAKLAGFDQISNLLK